ncbi:MAG: cytochrome C oxidase subunit IV family protein [Acidimicrobiaceae bacterium]|nr:cytochrome C oxidase subunit IV family protein [Acidimicrobiaceae bacterium]
MSETTTTERAAEHLAEHAAASSDPSADTEAHSEGHAHPSDWAYVKIALALAVITALEVFTYFESVLDWGVALVPSLLFMMVVKFYLVATWFMHLRFDSKLFGRMFTAGLLLAVGVYVATLAASEFFA